MADRCGKSHTESTHLEYAYEQNIQSHIETTHDAHTDVGKFYLIVEG